MQYAATLMVAVAAAVGYAKHAGLNAENLVTGIDTLYPVRATEYVRDRHLPGPIYNTFNWGGFLIFNLREYPVSIDGRNDLYGAAAMARARATLQGVDWKSDPDLARANLILLQKQDMLAALLVVDPDFKLVYADKLAVVLVRNYPVAH